MQIADSCVVSIHYTLTNSEGQTIDKSDETSPFAYLHGKNNIVPGLETELTGKSVGDSLKVTVEPEKGYGEVNPELVQEVPRSAFDEVESIEVGMQFQASEDDGQSQLVTITDIQETTVTVDGNHPLAGETLTFDVKIEEIRPASKEELEHGHAHGLGGHHH